MYKKIIIVITVSILTDILWIVSKKCRFLRRSGSTMRKIFQKDENDEDVLINEVMFFSVDSASCLLHLKSKQTCDKVNCSVKNFIKLRNFLSSAKHTLDICIYFLTHYDIARDIVRLQERDITIRVITDRNMADYGGSQIAILRRKGIRIRLKHMDVLMHHKFAIVDNNLLITGSANWTMQAFFGNFENIIVTNQPALVKKYATEFDSLWANYNKDK